VEFGNLQRLDVCPFRRTEKSDCVVRLLPRWTGRVGRADSTFIRRPPRLPDLTQCDFFFYGNALGISCMCM
jgi:hypothetical protein